MNQVLEMYPSTPVPPTREEMVRAILAFRDQFMTPIGPLEQPGSPADLELLALAERLLEARG